MTSSTSLFTTKRKTLAFAITSSLLSFSLMGCGGDDSGSSNNNNATPPASNITFSESATWTIEGDGLKSGAVSCYDFDAKTESSCDGDKWDIKFDNESRSVKLWSNSGDSGAGKGGVFGLLDWADLGRYTNATQDPDSKTDITSHYNADRSGGIFDEQPWFEYNLQGKHQLYPNHRVYMITTNNSDNAVESSILQPIYTIQIINYYNDIGDSGHPTLRWIDTAVPNSVKEKMINASNNDNWVYFDLATGQPTTKDGNWHIGFKRNDVILNGGDSGKGKVGGYLAATPTGYYDDKGELIASEFIIDNKDATLADLTNTANYTKPISARDWVVDSRGSDLNPAYSGNFPNLDYGWYTYNGITHQLNAKPIDKAQGALLRSAEGNSYARVRLEKINYPDNTATAATSWVFKFDIQPAPKP